MKLSKPIMAHGQQLTEITLKSPTGQQIRAARALPYWMAGDNAMAINTEAASRLLVACAAIPQSSVDQLAAVDRNQLYWEVVGFFLGQESEEEVQLPFDLKEPGGKFTREVKALPYWVSPDGSMTINTDAAAKYLVHCSGKDQESLDELSAREINSLYWAIAGFFLGGTSETQAS